MIKSLCHIPTKFTVAFSGGVDSVAVVDFLLNGKREVSLAFFHHGTRASDEAEMFVVNFARERNLPLSLGRITAGDAPRGKSQEEHWRNERYAFLESLPGPIITCHHLDDAIETWIFTSLHGEARLIPYTRGKVIRPFLITPKEEFVSWCQRRKIPWIEDESNNDIRYMRNLIRHRIVPEALKVNPGLRKTILKKYLKMTL